MIILKILLILIFQKIAEDGGRFSPVYFVYVWDYSVLAQYGHFARFLWLEHKEFLRSQNSKKVLSRNM